MIRIEYDNNLFIEFDDNKRTYFYGSNQQLKQKLVRSLKRFATGKTLNDLEEVIYGENGIEIYRNDQRLSSKNLKMFILQDNLSIFKEVDFIKGSLMQDYLQVVGQNVELENKLARINDELLSVELLINGKLSKISNNISSNLTELTYETLLKNQLFLSYFAENHDFPLEMMDANELIDEFINLLQEKTENDAQEIWLVLINPESFLLNENIQYLLDSSEEIAPLKVLIISYTPITIAYKPDDISQTVILADEVHVMPNYFDFVNSVKNHYPDEINFQEINLVKSFFEIACEIGKRHVNSGLSPKDLVLLKVINEIIGVEKPSYSVKFDELTSLEKSFLAKEN